MATHRLTSGQSPHSQKGIATILIVVLIGMALTATSLGIVHSIRTTQEKQVSVHAVTHAQTSLWMGVEAFRKYLLTLDDAGLAALANQTTPLSFAMDSHFGALSARNFAVATTASGYRISAEIINIHADAKSSATVGVVFEVNPESCVNCAQLSASLDFYDDLNIRGGIEFTTPENNLAQINVDGNITLQNVSISKLGTLQSTGTVTIGSAVEVENIYANGNVTITQGAKVDKASSLGTVTTDGGGYVSYAAANGDITSNTSGVDTLGYTSHAINSRANVRVTSGRHKLIKAGGTLYLLTNKTVDEAQSVGNAEIATWERVTSLLTEGNLTCVDPSYINFLTLFANGSKTRCAATAITPVPAVDVTVMDELQPYSMQQFVVDVWPLKTQANYIFEWDSTTAKTKVTLNNVAGATNGSVYYVGNGPANKKSHLCEASNTVSCTLKVPEVAVCLGFSPSSECFSYNTTTKTWTIDGTGSAPGVMWFDGNVEMSTGQDYTTILATGNVTTSGNLKLYSTNYAGYREVCTAVAPNIEEGRLNMRTTFEAYFSKQYPTNFCDLVTPQYKPSPIGNIAIAAGGFDPYADNQYRGGNITLGAGNEIFGAVIAGGILVTRGDTTVHGYITAAVLSNPTNGDNELGGKTTVDLSNTPATYDPTLVPDMSPCTTNCGATEDDRSKVLWSRYL